MNKSNEPTGTIGHFGCSTCRHRAPFRDVPYVDHDGYRQMSCVYCGTLMRAPQGT